MKRIAFKMQLFKGVEAEYQKRHDEIWPELKQLLKEYGISDYSLFLDETTNNLFGVMTAEDPSKLEALPQEPVMKRWWSDMSKLMDSHPDNSPIQVSLKEVFYLP
jgi:L-rhamnose mutarotase